MKIAITGHTHGIGKALFDLLSQSHDVVGYSITNGYDIGDSLVRKLIVKECKDVDVFINNAHHLIGQVDLLKKFIDCWDKQDKIIINLGSKCCHGPKYAKWYSPKYWSSKKALQKILSNRFFITNPKICNINPGYVDTEMTKHIDIPDKLSPSIIAEYVNSMLQYKDKYWIQEVFLCHPNEVVDDNNDSTT
jgi:NADP-dependent 3-hydroxy acid dehydrogenase YdfG